MDTIDSIIITWFNTGFGGAAAPWFGNLVLVLCSIVFAAIFSSIIGLEREYYGHAAGLRTHILVAVGSAIVMVVSIYGFAFWDTEYLPQGLSRDPARLAAQIVTGIGFLGAGTIIQTGTGIKGLTTATTIWIVMAIGIACGSGNFVIATIGTLIAYIALVTMRRVEKLMAKRNPTVVIVVPSDKPLLKDIIQIANRYSVAIQNTETSLVPYQDGDAIQITLRCRFATKASISAFADEIRFSLKPLEVKISYINKEATQNGPSR